MRILRFLGVLVAAMTALLCAVLLGVWLLVNPNSYKGRIVAAVKESTGRELKLPGDIKLAVMPWVALELGPASLGNPPGFGDEPFLSFAHATVRVRLLPLLRKRLEVARVEVDGLDLRLRKNAQGQGNWQSTEPTQPATAGADHGDAARAFASLANLRIQNARLAYEGIALEKLNLETGSITADEHIPIHLTFEANRAPSGEQLSLIAQFDLSRDAAQQLQFSGVQVSGTLNTSSAGRPAPWELTAPTVNVNLTRQTLDLPTFDASFAGAHLSGRAQAVRILDDLSITGAVNAAPLMLREFATRLAITLPPTRDPKALSQLSATTNFAYGSKALTLTQLQLRLDDTQIQGNLTWRFGEALNFDLGADRIDLDRYRAPAGAATAESTSSPQPAKPENPWELSGTLKLQSARWARLDLADVRVAVLTRDRVTHLSPVEAQIDGGRSLGDITWDSRGVSPALSVDAQLTGIDMARLLAHTAAKGRLSGRGTLNLKVTAQGGTADALLKTLNGHLDANLADGALEGVDVGYELKLAQALIDRSTAPPASSTGRTPFQAFKLSAQIVNGTAETHDLTIASQALKVAGQGRANLPTKGIDFKLLASIATASARNTDIPLRVTGTFADPTVKPDLGAVAKDQLRQKLQDVLKKNGLQGLFTK